MKYFQNMFIGSLCDIGSIHNVFDIYLFVTCAACIWVGGGAGRPECQALKRPRAASGGLERAAAAPLRI